MSVLDFNAAGNSNNAGNGATERVKAQHYLNIGYEAEWTDPETGEKFVEFISIPVGVAIDTMNPREVRGKDPKYRWILQSGNALLAQLQGMVASLPAGESGVIPALEVRGTHASGAQPALDEATTAAVPQFSFR